MEYCTGNSYISEKAKALDLLIKEQQKISHCKNSKKQNIR